TRECDCSSRSSTGSRLLGSGFHSPCKRRGTSARVALPCPARAATVSCSIFDAGRRRCRFLGEGPGRFVVSVLMVSPLRAVRLAKSKLIIRWCLVRIKVGPLENEDVDKPDVQARAWSWFG